MKAEQVTLAQMEALAESGKALVVGTWWDDSSIDLVRIGAETYALNGWNGEIWNDCWRTDGTAVLESGIRICPKYVGDLIPGFWGTHEDDGTEEWNLAIQFASYELA
jgi:hypothetical protein